MKPEDVKLLRKNGWEIECESPFEIRHENGSFASMTAANIIFDKLRNEEDKIKKTIKSLEELNSIELIPLYTESMVYEVNTVYNKLLKNQQKILQAIKIIGNNTIFYDKEDEI